MTTRSLTVMALIAAGACGRKADTGTDTSQAARDSAAAASAIGATTPVADTTSAQRGAPPPPPPRSAPGSATPAPPGSATQAADTVRGVIAVVGTDRDKQVVIRTTGGQSITLLGPYAALAGRASGADVWVSGTRADRTITVTSFAVRMVDGIKAMDGELMAAGTQLMLMTPDGTHHTITNPPAALREQVGARVWVSGNLDQGPVAFGIIKAKP